MLLVCASPWFIGAPGPSRHLGQRLERNWGLPEVWLLDKEGTSPVGASASQSRLWTRVWGITEHECSSHPDLAFQGGRGPCGGDSEAPVFTRREEGAQGEGERKRSAHQIKVAEFGGFGSAEDS